MILFTCEVSWSFCLPTNDHGSSVCKWNVKVPLYYLSAVLVFVYKWSVLVRFLFTSVIWSICLPVKCHDLFVFSWSLMIQISERLGSICLLVNCGAPLMPQGVYVAPSSVSVFGGDIVRGFCSLPIGFGEIPQITCSEETGQWEPWRLSCYSKCCFCGWLKMYV